MKIVFFSFSKLRDSVVGSVLFYAAGGSEDAPECVILTGTCDGNRLLKQRCEIVSVCSGEKRLIFNWDRGHIIQSFCNILPL